MGQGWGKDLKKCVDTAQNKNIIFLLFCEEDGIVHGEKQNRDGKNL